MPLAAAFVPSDSAPSGAGAALQLGFDLDFGHDVGSSGMPGAPALLTLPSEGSVDASPAQPESPGSPGVMESLQEWSSNSLLEFVAANGVPSPSKQ